MCRIFTPISQEASYNTVQLPGGFEVKLVKPAPLLTYNCNSRRFYRVPDFKVKDRETVLKIKLQLQRPSQNWNKSYLHCAIVELKCTFMINWMKRSKTSPKLQNQKWAGFFLLEWSKTNFDVCSLYIWVDPDQTVGKKWCQWNLKTTKNSVITHSSKYKHLN